MYTREEFEALRLEQSRRMADDAKLREDALDVLVRADKYMWIHQSNWMGEPVLQVPQDMFALQEIIYKSRPDYIVEAGVCWAGSLLFYSTLMEAWGGERVIGIDIYIPDDLIERIRSKGKVAEKIHLINNSSTNADSLKEVKEIVGGSRKTLVILDAYHTHDHVLQELRMYSPIVGRGQYIVCGDTIVEQIPTQEHRERPWGPGNNPMTALRAFLEENDRFSIDEDFDNKLLFTCNPSGYLRCIKE